MLPTQLQAAQFDTYPPLARELAVNHIQTLQRLPLSFLPGLLRQLIDYDYKFPAEQAAVRRELDTLNSLSSAQLSEWLRPFALITLSTKFESLDWINQPGPFVEQQSAYLWTTHQMDDFRKAAMDYQVHVSAATTVEAPKACRLGIAVIGEGVSTYNGSLFRNLREQGTYFHSIKPENGLELLHQAVVSRAKVSPQPYGHWYVDGSENQGISPLLTQIQYKALEPVRVALLEHIHREINRPGMGPEELRTNLARLSPKDLGLGMSSDEVLNRFQVKLLTEGSGTQIFSTTFVQWATREVLRRAQPLTLMARFAPRQKQRPMNDLLTDSNAESDLDFVGSLVDGEMAARYHWINQQRLPGSERSVFLAWFEGHQDALVIAPSLPRNTTSNSPLNLGELVSLAMA